MDREAEEGGGGGGGRTVKEVGPDLALPNVVRSCGAVDGAGDNEVAVYEDARDAVLCVL